MSTNTDPDNAIAPLTPGEETPLPVDLEFRDACYELIRRVCKNYIFGNECFSESDKWVKIYRVDFTVPDWNWPSRVSRIVCSQKRGENGIDIMVAVAQEIAPLPPPSR